MDPDLDRVSQSAIAADTGSHNDATDDSTLASLRNSLLASNVIRLSSLPVMLSYVQTDRTGKFHGARRAANRHGIRNRWN